MTFTLGARRLIFMVTAIAVLAACMAPPEEPANKFVWAKCSVAASFLDFHFPSAIRKGDVTYVAFSGENLDPYGTAYNHSSRRWFGPVKAGTSPLKDDDHGPPSLMIDAEGYVHIFYGAHGSPLMHSA